MDYAEYCLNFRRVVFRRAIFGEGGYLQHMDYARYCLNFRRVVFRGAIFGEGGYLQHMDYAGYCLNFRRVVWKEGLPLECRPWPWKRSTPSQDPFWQGGSHWPRVTKVTVMLSLCLVLGDSRRKPYSKAYSTMYFSSGHTETITEHLQKLQCSCLDGQQAQVVVQL